MGALDSSVAQPLPPARPPDAPTDDGLPAELTTLCTGEDGHLWICEGAEHRVRLTWSPDDFALVPGMPPLPGVMGELEDSFVFAHPTASSDGDRVAVFGLLPTLDDSLDGDQDAWVVAGAWPEEPEEDEPEDDVVGPGLVMEPGEDLEELLADDEVAQLLAGEDGLLFSDGEDDDDDEASPAFWPGGKVYVLDRDGVQVTQAFEFEDGSPTHIEWTPDDTGLLVLHQEEDHLLLHHVDANAEREPEFLAAGAPIFWSWQPGGHTLAARLVPPGGGPAQVVLGKPLQGEALQPVAAAGAFYVPAWHPDGSRLLYSIAGEREDELILADAAGQRLSRLLSYPGRAAFQWLADGRHVALAVAPEGAGPFQLLELLDVDADSSRPLWRGPFLAFLRAPTGVILCLLDAPTGRIQWLHLDLEGTSRPLGTPFSPAREALVALHFFEQVGPSHPWLSPDRRFLVCSGWLTPDTGADATGDEADDDEEITPPEVLITPLDGGPVRSLGPGRFACFAAPRGARG